MSVLTAMASTKVMLTISPLKMALAILAISITASLFLFKTSLSSWIAFVLILTFASGMMVLFIYTTSLAPNEKTTTKKSKLWLLIPPILMVVWPKSDMEKAKSSMKTFSSQMSLLTMAMVLLLTMLALASHSFNPTQTTSSSF